MGTCWNCGHKTNKKYPESTSEWKTEKNLCKHCKKILQKERIITSEDARLLHDFIKQISSLNEGKLSLSLKEQEFFLKKTYTDIIQLDLMFEKSTLFKECHINSNRLATYVMGFLEYFIRTGFDEELLADYYIDLYNKHNKLIPSIFAYNLDREVEDFYEEWWFDSLKTLISLAVRKLRLTDALSIAFEYGVREEDDGECMFYKHGHFYMNLKQLENRVTADIDLLDKYDSALREEKQKNMKTERELKQYKKNLLKMMDKSSQQNERRQRVKELYNLAENINSKKIKRELLSWVKSYETGNEPACEKIRPLFEMICEDILMKEGLMIPDNPEWNDFYNKNKNLEDWRIKNLKYGPELFLKIMMLSYHFKKPELKELEFRERGISKILQKYVTIGNPPVHTGSSLPMHLGIAIEDLTVMLEWYIIYCSKWKERGTL